MNKLFLLSDALLCDKIKIMPDDDQKQLVEQIINNRIVGIAYKNLDILSLCQEVRNKLVILKENSDMKCKTFQKNLQYLSNLLENVDFKYALLKGAFLSTIVYDFGLRNSNDIDIFIESKDVSKVQDLLIDNGFIQGRLDENNNIVPATRKEIVLSKMNFGETVPLLKLVDGKPFQIDINFSLDFKPDNRYIVPEMLQNVILVEKTNLIFHTLNIFDFIIQLCCHLYKEATTYDWVVNKRDIMLYKFSDINVFIHKYGSNNYFKDLITRIKHFRVERECYYTLENSSIIYPNLNEVDGFVEAKEAIKPSNLCFMTQITYPQKKKLFIHHMSFIDWFFCFNREKQLEEIPYETN